MEFKKVFSSVVRYATTMIAGHTDQYEGDYVKALSRLLNKMNEVSTRDEEEVENMKSSAEDYAGHPILDSHKAIASSHNYLEFVQTMLASMALLNDAKKYLEPDADKKWKAKWTEYLDNTSDNLEDFDSSLRKSLNKITENINEVKNERSIKAYMRPEMRPPSETAVNVRNQGIRQFAEAMGMLALDLHKGKERSQPNAKSIGALRNFLKINDISESEVDANMKMAMEDLNFDPELSPKAKIDIIRKGIATLITFTIQAAATGDLSSAYEIRVLRDTTQIQEVYAMGIARRLRKSDTLVVTDTDTGTGSTTYNVQVKHSGTAVGYYQLFMAAEQFQR